MAPDVSLQVNKFEQVSSDGHQMSLVGGECPMSDSQKLGPGGPMSDVQGGWGQDGGVLYSEVQRIMGNGHMGPPVNRWTDRHD